jgi:hypothetical protein
MRRLQPGSPPGFFFWCSESTPEGRNAGRRGKARRKQAAALADCRCVVDREADVLEDLGQPHDYAPAKEQLVKAREPVAQIGRSAGEPMRACPAEARPAAIDLAGRRLFGNRPNPAEPEPSNPVDGSARCRGRPKYDYDNDNDNDNDNDELCDGLFKTCGVRD